MHATSGVPRKVDAALAGVSVDENVKELNHFSGILPFGIEVCDLVRRELKGSREDETALAFLPSRHRLDRS
jgi:hypothetical protein